MKKIFYYLSAFALFNACTTYKDFLYSFVVSGMVTCNNTCNSEAKLSIVDIGLDSEMSKKNYVFYEATVQADEHFKLNKDYLWGTKGRSSSHQKVMITIETQNCNSFHKILNLTDMITKPGELNLDVGKIELLCNK